MKNANFPFKKILSFPEKVGEKPIKELRDAWFQNILPRTLLGAMTQHPGNGTDGTDGIGPCCRAWGNTPEGASLAQTLWLVWHRPQCPVLPSGFCFTMVFAPCVLREMQLHVLPAWASSVSLAEE